MRRLAAVVGTVWLVAASSSQAPTSAPNTPSASAVASEQAPQPGGRIVYGATGDPKTMQPVIATDTQSSEIWNKIYLSLTRANTKTGETEATLARHNTWF